MDNISRRRFLELSAVLGVAAISGGLPLVSRGRKERAYFLLTDRPTYDLERLLQLTRLSDANGLSIERTGIQPAAADLGIIEAGRLIDPGLANGLDSELKDFAHELRSRRRPAEQLIRIEPGQPGEADVVVFRVNGEVVERLSLRNNYRQITVAGDPGSTTFRLQDGYLSVTQASCRHEICKKMGPIRSGRIICAPNKLVATINPSPGRLDGITG